MSVHKIQDDIQEYCDNVVANSTLDMGNGNVLAVDTIAESTSANGVSVDGVTIKDGGITLTANVSGNIQTTGNVYSSGGSGLIGYGDDAGGAITQLTNASTGVILHKPTGQITTVSLTTAAGANEKFTVTNSTVAAKDVIVCSSTYNGNGAVICAAQNVTDGTFDMIVSNAHASAALNAVVVINFVVLKGQNGS